jgi:DNA-binding MarR family transcriptional regulator
VSARPGRLDAARLSGVISPLRRGLLRAARTAEQLPEIPDAQVEVLRALPVGAVRSPAEIAEELSLSRPTVSNLLRTMEAADLIVREPDPVDRRRVAVRASTRAATLLRRFDEASERLLAAAMSSLPEADRTALAAALPSLERLRDEIQAHARAGRVRLQAGEQR